RAVSGQAGHQNHSDRGPVGERARCQSGATFGLLLTIFGCISRRPDSVPYAVGRYITAAYWFTASTSFANPAVTIARSLSNTFAGIAPGGVMAFILSQLAGMLVAVGLSGWLWRKRMTA